MKRARLTGKRWIGLLSLAMVVGCGDDGSTGDDAGVGTGASSGGADDLGNEDGPDPDDGSGGQTGPVAEVPDNEYCAGVVAWTEAESSFEEQVVELVNTERAAGASCGGTPFGSTGPLAMEVALRCAARVHSLDMAVRAFFDHDNPDGEDPFDRMERAGYAFSAAGENIAAGQPTPEEVVQGWMESTGHCRNIMNPDFTEIGVGYVRTDSGDYPHYWTQTFGRPL